MIEAMERSLAWEYEYYETCNIAEALQQSDSFDLIHFHVGCYAIPLGAFSRTPILHTLHNPITPDAIWLLNRYANAAVTAVSQQQIAEIPENRRQKIRDRKSTRLNSSHSQISYAVFCLKKKNT